MQARVEKILLHDQFEPPIIEVFVGFDGPPESNDKPSVVVTLEMKDYSLSELREVAIKKAAEAMRSVFETP